MTMNLVCQSLVKTGKKQTIIKLKSKVYLSFFVVFSIIGHTVMQYFSRVIPSIVYLRPKATFKMPNNDSKSKTFMTPVQTTFICSTDVTMWPFRTLMPD